MNRVRIVERSCRAIGLTAYPDTADRLAVHLNRMGSTGVVLWIVFTAIATLPFPIARRILRTPIFQPIVGILAAATWAQGVIDAHPMIKSIIFVGAQPPLRPDTVGRVQVVEYVPEIVSGCALDDDWQLAANHPENLPQIADAIRQASRPIAWYTQAAVPGAPSVTARAGRVRLNWHDHPLVEQSARVHPDLLQALPTSPGVNPQAAVMALAMSRACNLFGAPL